MSKATNGLKRVLTLKHLVAFGLAYLAPTVVFNYYGIATSLTGGMMALAYLITMAVMFFTAYAYAQMVKAFPVSGSAYTYVRRAVNPWVGFGTGWVLLLDYLLLPMICFLLFGVYMNEYVPQVPTAIWVVLAATFGVVINILGGRISGRINIVLVSAQAVFCVVLVGLIVGFVLGSGGALIVPEAILDVARVDGGNLLWASSILAVSFLGFDAVSTLAEETETPEKTVPRAIMIVCIGAGVAFAVIAYFLQIAWPTAYRDMADPDTGIFELLPMIGGEPLTLSFWVTDQLASILAGMASITAVSRVLYSMGRDAILPRRFFGQLSPRFGTPVNNILLTGGLSLTAILYADNLLGAASLTSFGAITGFILVNYAVISHYVIREGRRSATDLFKFLVLPSLGILVNLVLWWNIDLQAKLLGGVWLLIGIAYLGFTTRWFKDKPGELSFDEDSDSDDDNDDHSASSASSHSPRIPEPTA